jgi:uncharacterized protein (DUF4415 family)
MAIVRITASENDLIPEASLVRLAALKDRPIDLSDIPESSPEELREIARQVREKRKKKMFSLRLATSTIEQWKTLGEGYTGIMSRLLAEAWKHPDWIRQCYLAEKP